MALTEQQKIEKVQKKKDRLLLASKAKSTCDYIMLLLGGMTVELGLSESDVDTMIMNHQPLYEALQAGRASKAHSIVLGMSPDAQVTQEMIDEMLEEFSELGL